MHDVVQLICGRLLGGTDTKKLAIVAEGGGQKWVLIAGMLARLRETCLKPNILGGSSGGGLAMLYYASGADAEKALVLQHLTAKGFNRQGGKRFLNIWRVLVGKPIMDIEGLIEDAFSLRQPVGWGRFATLKIPTFLIATTYLGAKVVQRLDGVAADEAKRIAKNTGRIPLIAHSTRDKHALWDGELSESLPIPTAFEMGATHVLALCTSARNGQTISSKAERLFLQPLIKRVAPELGKRWQRRDAYRQAIFARYRDDPRVMLVQAESVPFGSAETREDKLLYGLFLGWKTLEQTLQLPHLPYPNVWVKAWKALGKDEADLP